MKQVTREVTTPLPAKGVAQQRESIPGTSGLSMSHSAYALPEVRRAILTDDYSEGR